MHPAEADGQNEMPFGRDTHVVLSNTVLDGPGHPQEGEIRGSEPQSGPLSRLAVISRPA